MGARSTKSISRLPDNLFYIHETTRRLINWRMHMMTLVVFPNPSYESHSSDDADDRIARLTDAVYRVALEHGMTGSFVELQLGIWSAIRNVIKAEQPSDEDFVQDHHVQHQVPARLKGIV